MYRSVELYVLNLFWWPSMWISSMNAWKCRLAVWPGDWCRRLQTTGSSTIKKAKVGLAASNRTHIIKSSVSLDYCLDYRHLPLLRLYASSVVNGLIKIGANLEHLFWWSAKIIRWDEIVMHILYFYPVMDKCQWKLGVSINQRSLHA